MMRTALYISVILGVTFLTLRFIGLFLDLTYNDLFLSLGLILLIGVAVPLYMMIRLRYKQTVERILKDFKSKETYHADSTSANKSGEKDKSNQKDKSEQEEVEYPSFQNQKQGLKWGGGNIHGSTATRGSKRSFLKK